VAAGIVREFWWAPLRGEGRVVVVMVVVVAVAAEEWLLWILRVLVVVVDLWVGNADANAHPQTKILASADG